MASGSPMSRQELVSLLASMAAGYTRRELDRRFYDRLLDTNVGLSLKGLSIEKKYALEFAAYLATALATQRLPEATPLGQYLKEVLTDMPSEVARRVINGTHRQSFTESDFSEVVAAMSEKDFELLALERNPTRRSNAESVERRSESEGLPPNRESAGAASPIGVVRAVGDAADFVETLRKKIKSNHG
jgi:hypothetical protein